MLNNEICLVSGASRGIGRAIALALGAQGAVVVGTATSAEGAKAIDSYLMEDKIQGAGRVLDVTNSQAVVEAVDDVRQNFGPPTVLVNNAGIARDNLLLRMKEEDWDLIVDTNLKSLFRLTKACLRGMTKARRGRVINISSVVAETGNSGQVNYAATKAGILGFTKSLAREVAARNITVNSVSPGFMDTDMTKALPDEQRQALRAQIPLGRLGTPEDVANAVVFLASPLADYVTGANLHVNGGMFMA
ncbi:MAG: 3-oxoacyl-ACP reductase FabG [Gammaproteobacteria bacterium]|nr:3-oxoacyl-ACP reductase FabG [Gammaproteobacteria bacterium]